MEQVMSDSHIEAAESRHARLRGPAVAAAKALGLVVALAFLVLVSWNMFAPDVFGLEPIRLKQAVGIVVFFGVFVLLFRMPIRVQRGAGAS